MPWTPRQQALLRAMGLRVWAPAAAVDPSPELSAQPVARSAAVAPTTAPAPTAQARPTALPVAQKRPPVASPRSAAPTGTPAAGGTPAGAAAGSGPDGAAADAGPGGAIDEDQRRQRIATLDWPALRGEVAACRACGLCESRRQTVFGVGHAQARWMVIGEAPGEQEDRRGEPFVGPSGHLLDSMLAALGLTRDAAGADPARQVYIANTLKCRPPRNRNPEPAEIERCEPFLLRQIELLQPRIILAMGRFAVQALLRSSEPVGRLRGRVHRYGGVPLVVTYHPAYLLRNLADKAKAWDDLCLAAATAEQADRAAGPNA